MLRRIEIGRGASLAIGQDRLADMDLIAGLELLFTDAHSVDIRPSAGAGIDNSIPAVVRPNYAMIPCGADVGETHLGCRGASDFQVGGPQGETFAEQRTRDNDEFSRHPWWFSVSGSSVNRWVREREQRGSDLAADGGPANGVSTTCELAGRLLSMSAQPERGG